MELISREEVLECLQEWIDYLYDDDERSHQAVAVIKADIETMLIYNINLDWAREKVKEDIFGNPKIEFREEYYKGFLAGQEHEKRPKGKWKKIEPPREKTFYIDSVYCTNCNRHRPEHYKDYKYCPNCGAEMESEE